MTKRMARRKYHCHLVFFPWTEEEKKAGTGIYCFTVSARSCSLIIRAMLTGDGSGASAVSYTPQVEACIVSTVQNGPIPQPFSAELPEYCEESDGDTRVPFRTQQASSRYRSQVLLSPGRLFPKPPTGSSVQHVFPQMFERWGLICFGFPSHSTFWGSQKSLLKRAHSSNPMS